MKGITFKSPLGRARQSWRGLRVRVRRERATLMLGLLLALSVGEPLLCIAHCDLWLPFMLSSAQASPHQHMHHNHAQMASSQAPAATAGATVIQPLGAPEGTSLCAPLAGDSSMPFHVPPSPVHELTLAGLVPVLMALAFVAWQRAAPPSRPPPRFYRPPLRPPICSAA